MRRPALPLLALLLLLLSIIPLPAQTPRALFAQWEAQRLTRIAPSLVRHVHLRFYLQQLRAEGVSVAEVGRSFAGREIYQLEWGHGPLRVFMWSQMHGDEPTATSALVDLFHYLQRNARAPWVAAIAERITLRAVPMLNPDGAELFQRRNLQGIDINRDARDLSTPEGQLLKRLRDEWQPDIGFNLHNQNPRTSVGATGRQAAISLLAVPSNEERADTPERIRNKRLCAVMMQALEPFLAGHIGRYDDTFNPRAFGDMMGAWGTPTILIETGALHGQSEMHLVGLNFVAYLAALSALADGSYARADPSLYDALPLNEGGIIADLIVRRATVVVRPASDGEARAQPYIADIAINLSSARGGASLRRAVVQDVGDLSRLRGLEEAEAADYYVTTAAGPLQPGAEATLFFYRRERAARIDWRAPDLEQRFPPDAIYRNGAWVKRGALRIR